MHCKNSILQRIIVNKRYDVMKCKIYGWLLNCFEQYICDSKAFLALLVDFADEADPVWLNLSTV